MRASIYIVAALAATLAGTIARAAEPRECSALARSPGADVDAWSRTGPYAAGLRLAAAGRHRAAAQALARAWADVRKDLAPAFATEQCAPSKLKATLARNVFVAPPRAVPLQDRFAPPLPVAWAAARSACLAGDLEGAADWLVDHALPGDPDASAATAVLWAAARRTAEALALLPAESPSAAVGAARAFVLARAGRRGEADRAAASVPSGTGRTPLAEAILGLIEEVAP